MSSRPHGKSRGEGPCSGTTERGSAKESRLTRNVGEEAGQKNQEDKEGGF